MWDRKVGGGGGPSRDGDRSPASIGKQTLTDRAPAPAAPQPRSLDHLERELGPGASLDADTAGRTAAGGADVSGVRVHDGPVASQLAAEHSALAFTVGQNIVMGAGAPAAGTAAGDLLLSHELAHTEQQRGAATDPDARRRPIGDEDQAAETAAGHVALGSTAGSAMQTGLQLQRAPGPAKIVELYGKAAEQKLTELGGKLVTDPDYSDSHKAIVGSHVQYTVLGPSSRTIRIGVHQWTHDGPEGFHMQSITGVSRADPIPSAAVGPGGLFVNAHNVGSTTIPLSKLGAYRTRAWVRAGVDENGTFVGYELYIDHVIEATHIVRAIHEAEQRLPRNADNFDKFHDTMAVQTALLRPGDPETQSRDHQFGIQTAAANPSPISEGTIGFRAHDARQDQSKPVAYHWYVSAQTKDKPPETLGGRPMVTVAGRRGYDFGTGATIAMPAEHAGFWVVWYQAKDARGHDIGEASYVQTILSGTDMKSLEKHDQYMEHLDDLGAKIPGEKIPVRGVHVSEASGSATQLRLFVGKKDPSTFILIDATPGIDPKSNRLEYTSSSGPDVMEQFFHLNKYPRGRLRLNVTPNTLGIDTHMYEKETTGQNHFDRLSSNLSIGGMVALGVGILAAPVTRGQSLQVAMVVAGGLNAAAGAVSLYERLHNAEISSGGVALDVVNIASGLINAGGAVRGLTAGPAVLLRDRPIKFLLWANFAADGASALLIGVEGMHQLADILDNDQLRPEQKREHVIRVVTNLIMAGALLAVSYGQLREFRAKLESVLGKTVAAKLSDEVCMALSMLDDDTLQAVKGLAEHDLAKLGRAIREEPALMNLVKAEHRLAKILPLMKEGGADDLRFAIMRLNAHDAGVGVANSERLAAALADANVQSTLAMQLGKDFLGQFANTAAITELENVVRLQRAGRIKGLNDWVAFGAKKAKSDLANVVLELREAQRQAARNPDRVVHLGNDERAPLRANGQQMSSFDQTVETSHGTVEKSVEVTTIRDPLRNDADLSPALEHGVDKLKSRIADKAPIPGEHHLTIYAELSPPTTTKKGTQVIEPDGKRVLHTKNGLTVDQGNLFENLVDHIESYPGNQLLHQITVVDRQTGRVIVEFRFDSNTKRWSQVNKK